MAPRKRANCQICDLTESKYACPKCNIVYCSMACYKQHKGSTCKTTEVAVTVTPKNVGTSGETIQNSPEDIPLSSNSNIPSIPSLSLPSERGPSSPNAEKTDENPERVAVTSETNGSQSLQEPKAPDRPLRKLSSLKWPYVPDMPSHPDPLTRDDPKTLDLKQYEAIATSHAVRKALASHNRLPELLRSLDKLRGPDREAAIQRVLGVSPSQSSGFSIAGLSASSESYEVLTSNTGASGDSSSRRRRQANDPGLEVDKEDVKALRVLAEAIESAVRGQNISKLGLDWESFDA